MSHWLPLLLVAASLSAIRGLTSEDDAWASTENACEGKETETGECPMMAQCGSSCVRVDCEFGAWGEWSAPSADSLTNGKISCTSLCERARQRSRANSECGVPCTGEMRETKRCVDDASCYIPHVDCQMTPWSSWTTCASDMGQQTRARVIIEAVADGAACVGALSETHTCGNATKIKDCRVSEWAEWTICSKTCNTGITTRTRHVLNHATRLGKQCEGSLYDEDKCNEQECPALLDCSFSSWGQWSDCATGTEGQESGQQTRDRGIVPGVGGGKSCADAVLDTRGCTMSPKVPIDCTFNPWSSWSSCSSQPNGGQTYRTRGIKTEATNRGTCPTSALMETTLCNAQAVGDPKNDCSMGAWSLWSKCPVTCGPGVQRRNRTMETALPGGNGCAPASLDAVRVCGGLPCHAKDCAWSDWSHWSNCSKSCGGGHSSRERHVAVPPTSGGTCEAEVLKERKECNSMHCPAECINGEWADWGTYDQCSASCGTGYTKRSRILAKAPNHCGFPAVGAVDEFKACVEKLPGCKLDMYPDADCKLSAWSAWADCSKECRGLSDRKRVVEVYAHGTGKSCGIKTLKEDRICAWNSSCPEKVDCEFSEWSTFSPCTVTCGGGHERKVRSVVPNKKEGKSCKGELDVVHRCNGQACDESECIDCVWEEWSTWDSCPDQEWPSAQRARTRVVKEIGNYCGKRCKAEAAEETQSCGHAEFAYCAWQPWSEWDPCDTSPCAIHGAACNSPISRTRKLHFGVGRPEQYLVKASASDHIACSGSMDEMGACPHCPRCVPKDCKLSDWSEWDQGEHEALCKRSRVVAQANNECGSGCKDILTETKQCPQMKLPMDCVLGSWALWSECTSQKGQRDRVRNIETASANGGFPCAATLQETKPCNASAFVPRDCEFSDWGSWDSCTASCLGGSQERERSVVSESVDPGKPCHGALKELQACNTGSCDRLPRANCTFSAWSSWSAFCDHNQRFRERAVSGETNFGQPCTGPLRGTSLCANNTVDCDMTVWTAWTHCTVTCGSGQQLRVRQVNQYPQSGGSQCGTYFGNASLSEVKPCDKPACDWESDCLVSEWAEWTICTTTCGVGQQLRARHVDKLRSLLGAGCKNHMSEVRSCSSIPKCSTDCIWGEWQEWGACPRRHVRESHQRFRNILQAPTANGVKCDPHKMEEIKPCPFTGPDACIDGKWQDWSPWSMCSTSCAGGWSWRVRTVAITGNACGLPVKGLAKEVKECNQNTSCSLAKDCTFGMWLEWDSCSASCNGLQARARNIDSERVGLGTDCDGTMDEVRPCGAGVNKKDGKIPCVDVVAPCVMSSWSPWSSCSVSCGSGQMSKTRAVTQHANCTGALSETKGCNTAVCNTPVDCKWGDWSEWGDCDACGGQRHRTRMLKQRGDNGGVTCKMENSQEEEQCPRKCRGPYLCSWAGWSSWSECSQTCGRGKRTRTRILGLHNTTSVGGSFLLEDDAKLEDQVQELYRKHQHVEAQRVQHLTIAFLSGSFSLVLLFLVVVVPRRAARSSRGFQRCEFQRSGLASRSASQPLVDDLGDIACELHNQQGSV